MADQTKNRDNKDAEESGRPVQLDREQQGGKTGQQQGGQHDKAGQQQQGGQPDKQQQDKATHIRA